MEIEVLKSGEESIFILNGINAAIANTIRRLVLDEVPTLAVEELNLTKNSSALYDETIAHRIGLVPLKTDLESYNLSAKCKCKGEGCARCRVNFKLKMVGPCVVNAENLEFDDPKVKPVYPKIPIVTLLKGQKLEMEGFAVLGTGREHMKFSPAHIYYRGYPELVVSGKANVKNIIEKCEDALKEKGKNLEITDITKWNEAYEDICEKNGVEVKASNENFVFFVESWGQLEISEILDKASAVFDEKLDELDEELKKTK